MNDERGVYGSSSRKAIRPLSAFSPSQVTSKSIGLLAFNGLCIHFALTVKRIDRSSITPVSYTGILLSYHDFQMFKPFGIIFGVFRNFMINIESEGVTADRVRKNGIPQNDSHYGRRWRQETSLHRFWGSERCAHGLPGFFARLEN